MTYLPQIVLIAFVLVGCIWAKGHPIALLSAAALFVAAVIYI